MPPIAVPKTVNATGIRVDNGYAKVCEVASALGRHERTIREYIRILHEDFGHPDFPDKLKGRALSPRQQSVVAELLTYKAEGVPQSQICDFLMADCSVRLTLNEACEWLSSRISQALLVQFKEHFSS
jgi:hypothetical protein